MEVSPMDSIDIKIDMSDPLPRQYKTQFVIVNEKDLKHFDQQKVSFVLFKVIRNNDTSPVFIIADVIGSNDLTAVLRRPPKFPVMYDAVKQDMRKVEITVKNGRYLFSHLMQETKHPLFSMLSIDNINVLTRCLSINDNDEIENLVNGWFKNEK